jgi:ribosomal protein L11 methyltransferase
MHWTRIDIPCPPEAVDVVAALVLAETGRGASVVEDGGRVLVQAWVPADWCREARTRLEMRLRAIDGGLWAEGAAVSETSVSDDDWSLGWRTHFQPFRVGERLVIKPSWEPWPPADRPDLARGDDLVLEIDPGGAFGTGTHPSTQLALRAMERHVRPGDRVVDVGCGSGILSLAALLLGAQHVLALDFDPAAVECARANLEGQGWRRRASLLVANGLSALRLRADVVVANITAEAAVRTARQASTRLGPGGRYIAAGFLETDLADVHTALAAILQGTVETDRSEAWASVVVALPSEAPA